MAAFKLPRLKANLAIVNSRGNPLDYFLRFWNIEVAPRIEKQEADQNALIAQIQAVQDEQAEQLALIIAAQARADAAYDLAENAAGSKYTAIDGAAGATSASSTVNNVTPDTMLSLSGYLSGGTLDADAQWEGEVTFSESDGMTTNVLSVIEISVQSNGLELPVGQWGAEDSTPYNFSGVGTFDGTVEYSVSFVRTGGSNYVSGSSINSVLTLTPKAS